MAEYIDRDILIKNIEQETMNILFTKSTALKYIRGAPAADVAEVRHGRWVFDHMTGEWSYYSHCSECNYQEFFANEDVEKRHKYCLNCGARMGKEANHGN